MKTIKWLVRFEGISLLLCFLGLVKISLAACDQTLNPGADVTSAVSAAAPGSTICLNAGAFGQLDIYSKVKSSPVTLQSVSGRSASVSIDIQQSRGFVFQNLTIESLELDTNQQGGTKNISVLNSTFTGQCVINVGQNSDAGILIDGNTFDNIDVCDQCYEGRVEIISNPWSGQNSGVTITRNHFGGPGESDGLQIGAYGVVVGPGNVFDGIVQNGYGRHVDAIQLYGQSHTTIIGNYFVNNDVVIMAPDGGDHEYIADNVFIGGGYLPAIQLGSHLSDSFIHNTVKNISVHLDKKMENTTKSADAICRDNIMINSDFSTTDSGGVPSCTNCLFEHNQFSAAGDASGTDNLIGMPTFTGGANPGTWAGYQLTAASLGFQAATDGKDMGVNYYGTGSLTPLPPQSPRKLRLGQ